jgi:sugar phosphate isomerase/epimerase
MRKVNISIASYSFHKLLGQGRLNVFGYLDLLKYRYHVNFADIWTGFVQTLDEDYIRAIRLYMDEHEMTLANLCVDGPFLWVEDPAEREAHRQKMLQYLKAAEILGAKTVRIDMGGPNLDPLTASEKDMYTMSDEAFEYIVNTYREYASITEAFGCKIGPENHWGWDRMPYYLKKVFEAVDHPAYGVLYHLRNFYDHPEEGEDFMIRHAMHTHIFAGSILYAKEVVRKLLNAGYDGAIGMEHNSGEDEIARVEWQLSSIRLILSELRGADITQPASPDYMSEIYSGVRQL